MDWNVIKEEKRHKDSNKCLVLKYEFLQLWKYQRNSHFIVSLRFYAFRYPYGEQQKTQKCPQEFMAMTCLQQGKDFSVSLRNV